jgi:hypothetical protein
MMHVGRWLVAPAFFAAAVGANIFLIQERPAAELVMEMQTSEGSQAKVFFDTGAGYNERESATRPIPADATLHQLRFPLPSKPVRSVRFDPLEIGGRVQIRRVLIQSPDSHRRLAELDPAKIASLNEIASITRRSDRVEVAIVESARDPQLLLPIDHQLAFHHSADELFARQNARTTAILLLLAACAAGIALGRRKLVRPVRAINHALDKWCRKFSESRALPFDSGALWFYGICLLLFLVLALGKFHGSSISIASTSYRWIHSSHTPVLGTPKNIRSDEWNYHTPTILNQLYRRDRLSVTDTLFGPGKAALLGNVPCSHFTQIFRLQFWAFFALPADLAFATYWQCKGLLLLTGVFTLLFLLTRSSPIAAIGALWYFFSAYTQWGYSWSSLLPEMVGSFCWTVALSCYLMIGRNRWGLAVAAIACALCAVNFALCAYPPQQLPLIVLGVALIAGWVSSNRSQIFRRDDRLARLVCLSGAWLIVAAVLVCFYLDAKETLLAAAATVYPGQRSCSGGGIPISQFLSHFLDFWKSEDNFPPSFGNICEASGYLWLAPITLLLARPPKEHRRFTLLLVCLWAAFLLLLAWMLLPIPAEIGRWFMFNRVPPFRCFHALGLINVVIVGLFFAERQNAPRSRPVPIAHWFRGLCAGAILILLLFRMNRDLAYFFSKWAIAIAGIYLSVLVLLLIHARPKIFAACLLAPLVLANGLINPLDRGLDVITSSPLFKAAHGEHQDWLDGKWVLFALAPWADQRRFWFLNLWSTGLLGATGIDIVDWMKIVPDRKRMGMFDPDKRYANVINRSGYILAQPLAPGEQASFETPSGYDVLWRLDPLDPRLKEIGVDRIAFASQLPRPQLNRRLAPLLEASLPGLRVYRLSLNQP